MVGKKKMQKSAEWYMYEHGSRSIVARMWKRLAVFVSIADRGRGCLKRYGGLILTWEAEEVMQGLRRKRLL
jgi:hypothetical protein